MRVRMNLVYFDKDKNALGKYASYSDFKFFKFELRHCPLDVIEEKGWGVKFQDEEHGDILRSSDLHEMNGKSMYNFGFADFNWTSDGSNLYICNKTIDI